MKLTTGRITPGTATRGGWTATVLNAATSYTQTAVSASVERMTRNANGGRNQSQWVLERMTGDTPTGKTQQEAAIENIRDLRGSYMDKRLEAIREGDEIGAAYFSGQVSGLIHAQEAIENAE